jgi:hypothetical protein
MYRVTRMSNRIYAVEIGSVRDEADNIEALANEGNPVLICDDLDDAAELYDVDVSDIVMA